MKVGNKLRKREGGWAFWCAGCEEYHGVTDGWAFNGNPDKPTFSPSILVTGTRMTTLGEQQWQEGSRTGEWPSKLDSEPLVCHSFITDGKIEYLNDCTHKLKGQTIDLPDLPKGMGDADTDEA